jgi:AcrR family transcriptional regulator
MRPQKVEDQALLSGLMTVLSAKGYDGASLNELAEASGLQKASLYHRFPAGKKEITSAVLNYVNDWVKKNIYALLTNSSLSPSERLKTAIKNINELYNNGNSICILRALSMDTGVEIFGEQIKESMLLWVKGFTALGEDCGFTKDIAREKAYQVLINIQGSLIVSKSLGSNSWYKAALKNIETMYHKS